MARSHGANTNGPAYETRDQWGDHLADTHGLMCYISQPVFFCSFCDDYVVPLALVGPSARIEHYATHLNDALEGIQKYGYNEVSSSIRGQEMLLIRHPWFCIFCVHNTDLDAGERISVCKEHTGKAHNGTGQKDHLHKHSLVISEP
jgi:hypothetical protein